MKGILSKIVRCLAIPEYRVALLRNGVFASTEHDSVLRGLDLATVVDIGASRGQFALCIRRLYPRARIYSFEPLAGPAATYRKVFQHDPNVRLTAKAIAAQPGLANMHVARWDVSSSILPIAQAQHDNFPFSRESGREEVSLATLTECLAADDITPTALLKLDVQGYELSALEGCEQLLRLFDFVYVEASFVELYTSQALATDVLAYLLGRGFRLICVANLSYGRSQRPIQADFLLAR